MKASSDVKEKGRKEEENVNQKGKEKKKLVYGGERSSGG